MLTSVIKTKNDNFLLETISSSTRIIRKNTETFPKQYLVATFVSSKMIDVKDDDQSDKPNNSPSVANPSVEEFDLASGTRSRDSEALALDGETEREGTFEDMNADKAGISESEFQRVPQVKVANKSNASLTGGEAENSENSPLDGSATVGTNSITAKDDEASLVHANSNSIHSDMDNRVHANSSHSDMDTSVSVAASYSADNEFPALHLISRRRGQKQHTIPENTVRVQWSPVGSDSEEPPPDFRKFPNSPFNSDHQWDNTFGMFPTSFDSNNENSGYGSMDSSGNSESETKRFTNMITEQSQESDNELCLSNHSSARISPRSTSSAGSFDVSSSERTPILSNHAPRRSSLNKSPGSIKTIDEENVIGVKEELKVALLKSPSRNALTAPSIPRPEPLHKLLERQKSISFMVGDLRGKKQPTSFRDVLFAIVYILQLLVIICLGLSFGPDAFGLGEEEDAFSIQEQAGIHFAYVDVLMIIFFSGILSIVFSAFAFMFMAVFAKQWIKMALRLAATLSIVLTLVGLIQAAQNFVPVLGLFATALTIAYAFMVWDEIPFVSANLYTALVACRSAFAIIGIAIVTQICALVWIAIYFLTSIGLYNHFQEDSDLDLKWHIWAYIGLGLSFNWTIQTMMNIMEVCIAGYINRWWLEPKLDESQKLDAIGESLVRAIVYSFGSVCFGSMFIGLVNALREIANQIRPNPEEAPIKCLVVVQECIVSCIDVVASIFNDYAMINIGMYGYDFLEAGKQANTLFQKRGWQDIVSNSLLSHLLLIISLIVASLIGCVSVEIERVWELPLVSVADPSTIAFCIGFSVGLVLSNILFNVITSSVKSVVVCFAGNPVEFQQNHPECSHIMREAWKESWPGLVDFVDTGNRRSPNLNGLRFKRESLESLYV